MHLILTGATGLVGSGVLNQMLQLIPGEISKLTILSRRPVPMADGAEGVTVIEHKDFETYPPELLKQLQGAEGCVWAQGISVSLVNKEDYVKITKDYPLAAAKAFSRLSDSFKFVYISGAGVTTKPGPFTQFFAQIKGETESSLLSLPTTDPAFASLKPYSLRPGMVDSATDPAVISATTDRNASLVERLIKPTAPLWRAFLPGLVSPTQEIGIAATRLAMGGGGVVGGDGVEEGRILSNEVIRRLAREGFEGR
ncbi:hypothetical protein FQN52_006075 [Onygenales sp. PD_12]|nr:hypothetical protein FQN52_006075 [Onygenales sp. PD_12]